MIHNVCCNCRFETTVNTLKHFVLNINENNIETIKNCKSLANRKIQNISFVDLNGASIQRFLAIFCMSLNNVVFDHCKGLSRECLDVISKLPHLESLSFKHCKVVGKFTVNDIPTLSSLSFVTSSDILDVFKNQTKIQQFSLQNDTSELDGFNHKVLNLILSKSKSIKQLKLFGNAIGSYFDCDKFPYKLEKLDTTAITFRWYVGITGARTTFLESQRGSLKELIIHKFPYDFDGGRVLKYIFEQMNLKTFYYKNTPMIDNYKKQPISDIIEFSELEVNSIYEIVRQFQGDNYIFVYFLYFI